MMLVLKASGRNYASRFVCRNPFLHFFGNFRASSTNNYTLSTNHLLDKQIHRRSRISHEFCCVFVRTLSSTRFPCRSFRKRRNNRLRASSKLVLDQGKFQQAIARLQPRFTAEELFEVISEEEDPLLCFELFNWASQQPRFRHDVSTYHITIKKLGVAKMYEEMDHVVNQVLALRSFGSEPLYNSIIYFFAEARKLTRAVNIFKHMKNSKSSESQPSIRTYNILFTAMLSRGRNTYINYMYMQAIRGLFRQMISDGIEPDIYSLNSMIKGYVLSLHVNDALRIFHQMGSIYNCSPNAYSYDYLIYGLCAQDRTMNARQMFDKMKEEGFIPSSKSHNSIVNALALGGELEAAVVYLKEMIENRRSADFITYRTVLDEMCRRGRDGEAMVLLKDLQDKDIVDGQTYRKLLHLIEDGFDGSTNLSRIRH